MLRPAIQRCFSVKSGIDVPKNVCILANSRQADLTGAKLMHSLKKMSGEHQLNFYGYGGQWM